MTGSWQGHRFTCAVASAKSLGVTYKIRTYPNLQVLEPHDTLNGSTRSRAPGFHSFLKCSFGKMVLRMHTIIRLHGCPLAEAHFSRAVAYAHHLDMLETRQPFYTLAPSLRT